MVETIPNLSGVNHLSGRAKRKLKRMNTVHLRGVCPNCKDVQVRFFKDIYLKGQPTKHNRWLCKKCRGTFTREELKDVKYV